MIYGYKRPIQGDKEMQQQLRTVTLEKIYEITHPYAKKQGKTIGRPKKIG